MKTLIIIPARHQSTRLPGKPLLDIAGKPMIQHVYEQSKTTHLVREMNSDIMVATDDQRIVNVVRNFGCNVMMTSKRHKTGMDRIAEVVRNLELNEGIVVNVQGDEPLIPPAVIDQLAQTLKNNRQFSVVTLYTDIEDADTFHDPSVVKVVMDNSGKALYFSRSAIPALAKKADFSTMAVKPRRHIGVYAYRAEVLTALNQLPLSNLEQCEKLEQLRLLQCGIKIHVTEACCPVPHSIDTEKDLKKTITLLQ